MQPKQTPGTSTCSSPFCLSCISLHLFSLFAHHRAIIHAWSFWYESFIWMMSNGKYVYSHVCRYYASGGLFLWLFDRCVRLARRTRALSTVHITYHADSGVVCIWLSSLACHSTRFFYELRSFSLHPTSLAHPIPTPLCVSLLHRLR